MATSKPRRRGSKAATPTKAAKPSRVTKSSRAAKSPAAARSSRAARAATPAADAKAAAAAQYLAAMAAAAPYPRALAISQLARVRQFCHQLPDVTERPSHGSPTFFASGRSFASFLDNHHGDGRLALWCAAPDGAQAMLVDSDPDSFFLPPYVAHQGWIGVRLDRDLAWNRIAMVLEAAHQMRYKPPRGPAHGRQPRGRGV